MPSPYEILGVPLSASKEEIRRAYRALAAKWHPDLHPNNPAAAKKMVEINGAWETLSKGPKPAVTAPSPGRETMRDQATKANPFTSAQNLADFLKKQDAQAWATRVEDLADAIDDAFGTRTKR